MILLAVRICDEPHDSSSRFRAQAGLSMVAGINAAPGSVIPSAAAWCLPSPGRCRLPPTFVIHKFFFADGIILLLPQGKIAGQSEVDVRPGRMLPPDENRGNPAGRPPSNAPGIDLSQIRNRESVPVPWKKPKRAPLPCRRSPPWRPKHNSFRSSPCTQPSQISVV